MVLPSSPGGTIDLWAIIIDGQRLDGQTSRSILMGSTYVAHNARRPTLVSRSMRQSGRGGYWGADWSLLVTAVSKEQHPYNLTTG